MRLPLSWVWALSLAGLFLFAIDPIRLDDFFLYLSFGRRLFELGEFGSIDPYIFSIENYKWDVMHEWLSYVYYYGVYLLSGYWGVIFFRAVFVTCTGALILKACKRSNLSPFSTLFLFTSVFVAAFPRCFKDRSSFFSDFLTAVLIFIFTDGHIISKASRVKWFIPFVFLFWVQIHPGYLIAWALIGIFLLSNWFVWDSGQKKEWSAIAALSIVMTVANPTGPKVIWWPIYKVIGGNWGVFSQINEWVPSLQADFLAPIYKIFLIFFLLTGIAFAFLNLRNDRFGFPAALLMSYLALASSRFLALAALGMGILIAASISKLSFVNLDRKWINVCTLAIAIIMVACVSASPSHGIRFISSREPLHATVPEAAVEYLMAQPPGNTFNEWDLGGFLIWKLDGRQKISAHGFISDPNLVRDKIYQFSVSKEGWDRIIVNGGVEYFIIRRQTYELSKNAAWIRELDGPDWLKVYIDRAAVIFRKNHGS